jgi:hypothetical protein
MPPARTDSPGVPLKETEGRFGRLRPVGEHRGKREDVATINAVDLLQLRNWKTPAKKREGWRKVTG